MSSSKPITWAHYFTLIGGMAIAQEKIFGSEPEFLLSNTGFQGNDQHYVAYMRNKGWNGEYIIVDGQEQSLIPNATYSTENVHPVDVVGVTAPCAGLSSMSVTSNADSAVNDHMKNSALYIVENIKPKIVWGENAPFLATNKGKKVADDLYRIASDNGYSLLIYSTESRLHNNPQKRPRSFYFMFNQEYFKGVPLLDSIPFKHVRFEDYLTSFETKESDPMNIRPEATWLTATVSDNPYYQYISEKIGCKTYREFIEALCNENNGFRSVNIMEYAIQLEGYEPLVAWLSERNYERQAKKIADVGAKLKAGKGAWTHHFTVARNECPGYISHNVYFLMHPYEDRGLTLREGMNLMGLPEDFLLLGDPNKNINYICQNVPVYTAADMCTEIVKFLSKTNMTTLQNESYVVQRKKQGDWQSRTPEKNDRFEEFF